MKTLVTLCLSGLALYLITCLVIFVFQRKLLYFPTHEDHKAKGSPNFPPLRTDSGEFLGYLQKSSEAVERVVVFFHGNGGEALHRQWLSQWIPKGPIATLIVEYPGYGAKKGRPTQTSILETAKKAIAWAQQFQVPISLIGESLGSGIACSVATLGGVDRLALISPYDSVANVAAHYYPWLPVKWLLRDRFSTVQYAKEIQVPTLIVHGTADTTIPIRHGKRLFDSLTSPKKFISIEGAEHNQITESILHSPRLEVFRKFVLGQGKLAALSS